MARPGLTREKVKRSIEAMRKSHGERLQFTFDPNDEGQISEYMQLRQGLARISPETLMSALKNKKTTVDSTASNIIAFYAVPRINFPDGLPSDLKASEISEEDLDIVTTTSGAPVDTDSFFILDCEVERSKLGKLVRTLQLSLARKSVRDTSGSVEQDAGLRDLKLCYNNSTEIPESPSKRPKKAAANPLDRQLSRSLSDTGDEELEQAKQLQNTLRQLKENLRASMDQNIWNPAGMLHTKSVKFLLEELAMVLGEMKTKTSLPQQEVGGIAVKVAKWLVGEFLHRDVFEHLRGFGDTLTDILQADLVGDVECEQVRDMLNLIRELSKVSLSDPTETPNLRLSSVTSRTKFLNSTLYKGFLRMKVDSTLDLAKKATGRDRMNLLDACKNLPDLPEGMRITSYVVSVIFNEDTTLQERIEFMCSGDEKEVQGKRKLAEDWDCDGVIGLAAHCMSEEADLTGKSYKLFEIVAEVFLKTASGNNKC